jgi:hypothetical protein
MSYTLEQQGVLVLGQVRRRRHADAYAHMGLVESADTIMRVIVRKETHHDIYRLQVVGEGGSVPHRNWVHQCVVDTAFHLAQPQAEGLPPDRCPAGHHRPYEGSKVQCTWVNDNDE